jgi:hypothetical protein
MPQDVIEHEEESDEYVIRETIDADHHTAIVSSVSSDGLTYQVIEQNANDLPTVTSGDLHLDDMKHGYILVYRAVPDPDSGADATGDGGLQGNIVSRSHVARVHRNR